MKAIYSNLAYLQQLHVAGIVSMQLTPREWVQSDPVIDFESGRVLQTISLLPGKFWLSLDLTPASYAYQETQKTAKSGDYFEVSATGLLNDSNYAVQQVLETVRQSEVIVTMLDRKKRRKIIGDTLTAMKLTVTHTHKNNPGQEKTQLDLAYTCEGRPPYYNPDNTPETSGNFLINSNGDFLLVG